MEWEKGTRFGWFLGGIIIMAGVAMGYFVYRHNQVKREESK